ncbi:hypothetical protein E2C01_065565 [Portunus trituberculatus]|uniref:Uncharacterized protein n=1 Tax=Portunus trituberculatus TaxID=210409 RepID=A0A5B7HM79_PORTR|nr:hypothetical protein [Portunus trituberculatus]
MRTHPSLTSKTITPTSYFLSRGKRYILSSVKNLIKQRVTMLDIRPNHTIYVNNLNEKVKKDGESEFLFHS